MTDNNSESASPLVTHTEKTEQSPGDKDDVPQPLEKTHSWWNRVKSLLAARREANLHKDIAALSHRPIEGTSYSAGERAMLGNILKLREMRVVDVMVARAEIESVDLTTTLADLLHAFEQSGHSRMPVFGDTLDDPRGMIHIRDVLAHINKRARHKRRASKSATAPAAAKLDLSNVDLTKTINELNLMRPVLFVPPSMHASDLMARMQAERIQMALVIDEYGGTDGLVSLEDLVEIVVGDIEDEHDDEELMINAAGNGVFLADARVELDDAIETIGKHFDPGAHVEDADTIGGLIFSALGRVPARGEVVKAIPGFEFHIIDADPRRIKKVRIVETRHADRRRRAIRASA